jgi:PAS domain S-box-containing protein
MDSGKKHPRFPWHLLVVFSLLAAGIVAVGYFYYHGYERHHRTEVERQLLAIAELKTDELADWRRERMGDAGVFFKNAAFSALVRRHFGNPDDAEAQSQLRSWLGQFQAGFSYGRVFLLDASGVSRMQVPDAPEPLAAHLPQDAAETLRSGKITFLDFHRAVPNGPIHLSILVPILDEQGGNRPLGVLALRIDPTTHLYPFISRWPTPSPTAETLLVRHDGDDVLFLNELRFQKNTVLVLRSPLTKKEMPSVMAALGQEGIVEGVDYRGVAVVAAVRAVPDSPWFLVARMDASEVYAPVMERLWIVIMLVGALLLGAGAALGVAWRHQSTLFYKEKFEAAEVLRASEEKYRTLFQTMAQGVVHQSADGKIISANPAAEQILGLTLDEMQGRTSIDPRWRATHEDGSDFPGQTHPAMVALQTGREVRDVVMGVYNPRTESHVWININAVPRIEPGDDKPCQVYTTFDDITARKRAEQATKKAQAELLDERQHEKEHAEAELARTRDRLVSATRLAAIGQVSASIAHDLRNPLGTVRNAAYYLGRRLPKDQPEVAEYLGIINQEVAAADRIITNLLAVARAKKPVKQHVDLGQTIREALAGTGQAEAVRLRMSLAPEPFMVRADPDQLRQVFRNLVNNAMEAMGKGSEIVVEAARDADGDSIVFRDTGPGVSQEVRESLFEPLVTTKARGIGLGLTICRQIIEHHGGSIELIDKDKSGAAFRIRLP